MRGLVPRPRKIRVDYLDEKGSSQKIIAEDFLATVFQHELEHLEGKLYVDSLKDSTYFCYDDQLEYFMPKEDSNSEETVQP